MVQFGYFFRSLRDLQIIFLGLVARPAAGHPRHFSYLVPPPRFYHESFESVHPFVTVIIVGTVETAVDTRVRVISDSGSPLDFIILDPPIALALVGHFCISAP